MDYDDAVATFTGVDANTGLQDTEYKEINQNDLLKNNDLVGSKATSSAKISGAVSKCRLNRKYSDAAPSALKEIPNKHGIKKMLF